MNCLARAVNNGVACPWRAVRWRELRTNGSPLARAGSFPRDSRRAHVQFKGHKFHVSAKADDAVEKKSGINMGEELYAYVLQHTREQEVLKELRAETSTMRGARMQITPEQGAFMTMLVGLSGARRAIEVGTYTGYSSFCIAQGLPDDGYLLACDTDADTMAVARKYWDKGGVSRKIESKLGPAINTLTALLADGGADKFDLAFIDADKRNYHNYYELLLKLVRPGGAILVDNVLWYGRVADPSVTDANTVAIRELNDFLVKDERVDFSLAPIGDGIAICRRRK
eukprot:jgi/Mesvir1/5269/Mv15382-RA.1